MCIHSQEQNLLLLQTLKSKPDRALSDLQARVHCTFRHVFIPPPPPRLLNIQPLLGARKKSLHKESSRTFPPPTRLCHLLPHPIPRLLRQREIAKDILRHLREDRHNDGAVFQPPDALADVEHEVGHA